jgi:outer membrane protein assembly factor BamB
LSDYPGIFAFSADGKTLAAHGISSVHLVDVPRRAWTATHPSKEASCLQFHDDGLIVGSKTLTLLNRESGKKVRSFKGHNATPNALALSADGKVLWSGGGRYCDTRDRFLFAFDATTGEPIYKVKPGKNAGAMDVAVLGDVLAVAAEDGHLRTFSAAEGKPLGDIALAPPVEHGSSFGGVAVSGASFVAAAVVADVCVVTWLSRDLAVETTAKIALDGSRYLSAEGPFVVAGHIVIPLGMNWTSSDESGVVVAVFDEDTRALVALRTLAGLDDARACTVSADGLVAWKAKGGVQLAELVGAGPKRGVQATSRSQAR